MRLHSNLGIQCNNIANFGMSSLAKKNTDRKWKLRTLLARWQTAFLAKRSLGKKRDCVCKRHKRGAISKQDKKHDVLLLFSNTAVAGKKAYQMEACNMILCPRPLRHL